MKNIIACFMLFFCIFITAVHTQTTQSSNPPAKASIASRSSTVYGVFAGRTPCQEFLKEFNLGENPVCTKRKMGVTLYQDSVTHKPTIYETWGMAKWTGTGRWHVIQGTAADPKAIVFQLDLDTNTFLYLLKGDENVLFILDKDKNFLIGNADHSYTLNREGNKLPWDQRLDLINKGRSN
jgi:hypothetical protein